MGAIYVINPRAGDLNPLPLFEAAYEERNMIRAADRLARSQPAVSNAVVRLRSALRDDLFVPGRRGATVTPLAEAIYSWMKDAPDRIREGLGEPRKFAPKLFGRRFSLATLNARVTDLGQAVAEWTKR